MNNEFDLERARSGDRVEYKGHHGWENCKFFGVSGAEEKMLVIERYNSGGCFISYVDPVSLRMAPKTAKARYRNFKMSDGVRACVSTVSDQFGWETPDETERKAYFRGWIHNDWQEVEVEL